MMKDEIGIIKYIIPIVISFTITITLFTTPIHGSKSLSLSLSLSPHKRIPFVSSSPKDQQLLTQWAREAIAKGDTKFKDVEPVVDPNSNADTKNQKSIYIATEFLNNASPDFMGCSKATMDGDRLVKVGRSIVDLVELAEMDLDTSEGKEESLMLGLTNIVQQCDILAKDDLKVRDVLWIGGSFIDSFIH